jgi:hypothetical protein
MTLLQPSPRTATLTWSGACASPVWRIQTKAVRNKVAGKGQQQYYWTEAVQVTNTDDRPELSSERAPDIDKTS